MVDYPIVTRFAQSYDGNIINRLCELINSVYQDAESGLFKPGLTRITPDKLLTYINKNELLLSEINGELVGCVYVALINGNIAKFGMLTTDSNYRGMGVGRELVNASET